jgi:hypothetical protein
MSYASDILLPFAGYFLLIPSSRELPAIDHDTFRFSVAFALPALAETLQYLGIEALGVTFDPVDYVMYAVGAGTAALVDHAVFSRLMPFWRRSVAASAG